MQRGGVRGVEGVSFTEENKESMATVLKENMRKATCLGCGWVGYVDTRDGDLRTANPSCGSKLRPLLHLPYDEDVYHELNVERYEQAKTGRLLFNHAEGTHDDRFWALALAMDASGSTNPPQRPLVRI